MEPEADKLMQAAMNKNAIDLAQYPACSHIQVGVHRCDRMDTMQCTVSYL